MSSPTSPLLNSHSVEKGKWLGRAENAGWMNALQKKMAQLQDLNVLKYRAYIYIITFKRLKFYKVDSLYWPTTNKQIIEVLILL